MSKPDLQQNRVNCNVQAYGTHLADPCKSSVCSTNTVVNSSFIHLVTKGSHPVKKSVSVWFFSERKGLRLQPAHQACFLKHHYPVSSLIPHVTKKQLFTYFITFIPIQILLYPQNCAKQSATLTKKLFQVKQPTMYSQS